MAVSTAEPPREGSTHEDEEKGEFGS
jgi:hypothetical protein